MFKVEEPPGISKRSAARTVCLQRATAKSTLNFGGRGGLEVEKLAGGFFFAVRVGALWRVGRNDLQRRRGSPLTLGIVSLGWVVGSLRAAHACYLLQGAFFSQDPVP